MFVDAIETAANYTRAIHTISRNYLSETIQAGTATLFFVNADGWALTCAHVAKGLVIADQVRSKYDAFKAESATGNKKSLKAIEAKYNLSRKATVEIRNNFVNCVDGYLNLEMIIHPTLDVALLKFSEFSKLHCDKFPVFAKDSTGLKPGKTLCRLGFPFPEFTNFSYDKTAGSINWTVGGKDATPRFPIDGMLTRQVADSSGNIEGFEMSTPGLRGAKRWPSIR